MGQQRVEFIINTEEKGFIVKEIHLKIYIYIEENFFFPIRQLGKPGERARSEGRVREV